MNEERLNKLLEDIDNALYYLKICQCNINVTAKGHKWETYYGLDDDLIKYIREIESSNKNLQSKIDKANELLEEILVVSDWEHKGRFRPVKETTAQDVYKTIVKLNELLETPRRINYELLKEEK